ncbi:MAG TPA: hypothetical protein VFY29_18675 [Terriglobia bacterium]|nr:hypothetical protein [Terriglobia bacterium]
MVRGGVNSPISLYLIRTPRGPCLVFASSETVRVWEQTSTDHLHQAILWLRSRHNRVVAWVGKLLESARAYHGTLEDRLDPAERILRAMAGANGFVVYHGTFPSGSEVLGYFRAALRRQKIKHWTWFALDWAAIAAAIPLSPLPGPNVLLYYPVLRVFSHYRAVCGVKAAVSAADMELRFAAALDELEGILRTPRRDTGAIQAAADALNVDGLGPFIERMVP